MLLVGLVLLQKASCIWNCWSCVGDGGGGSGKSGIFVLSILLVGAAYEGVEVPLVGEPLYPMLFRAAEIVEALSLVFGLIGTGTYPSVPLGGFCVAAKRAWISQYNLLLKL